MPPRPLSRRTVARGAAWTLPTIAIAAPAPARASSPSPTPSPRIDPTATLSFETGPVCPLIVHTAIYVPEGAYFSAVSWFANASDVENDAGPGYYCAWQDPSDAAYSLDRGRTWSTLNYERQCSAANNRLCAPNNFVAGQYAANETDLGLPLNAASNSYLATEDTTILVKWNVCIIGAPSGQGANTIQQNSECLDGFIKELRVSV